MKAAIEKLIRGETIEVELTKLNEAFNKACTSSTISSGVKKIEKMKNRLRGAIKYHGRERIVLNEPTRIQRIAAATITLESDRNQRCEIKNT